VELEAQSSSRSPLTSGHQIKRCDSQLQLPATATAAAADSSLMQFGGEADKRLSERERIKRAKHNGGASVTTLGAEICN